MLDKGIILSVVAFYLLKHSNFHYQITFSKICYHKFLIMMIFSDISAEGKDTEPSSIKSPPFDMRMLSPRQQVCFELFQTESNYVGILHTIMTVSIYVLLISHF